MKNVEYDAYLVAQNIFQSILRGDKYTIANIAKSDIKTFNYPSIKEIPWSFGYSYDNVPRLLSENGVIVEKIENRWFTKRTSCTTKDAKHDQITNRAIQLTYFEPDETANYYIKYNRDYWDFGPQPGGLYACLVDVKRLVDFINWFNFYLPKFDIKNGILNFLGSSVKFEGEYQLKAADLLIKNLNSRVTNEDFYNLPRDLKNFKGTAPQKEASKKLFKEIREKIELNSFLANGLVCIQRKGFGIFIDNQIYSSFPQNP